MKTLRKQIGAFMITLSVFIGAFINIIAIGYGLYLWGAVGITFALAAWLTFKFWAITLAITLVVAFIGAIIAV